jgi:site-specific DNA-methyltransferase (adenine-specific)
MFSSLRLDWRTPTELYKTLDAEFHFNFDPCPSLPKEREKFNGLAVDWGSSNFVNPPYGNEIGKWIKKGYEEWLKGKTVVFLIPSRTDTAYWHDYVMKADEIRFIRGRVHFVHPDKSGPAPFPSAIVVFRGSADQAQTTTP